MEEEKIEITEVEEVEENQLDLDDRNPERKGKGSGKSIEEQRAALPDVEPKKINLISDALKEELKQLINEVLDERND